MYERFFGLRERPFDLLPNPRFLYLAGRHREAYSSLQYGLATPRGLTLLIGEAGTGKTTLVQSVLAELDGDAVEYVLLSNPTLTRAEFFEFLAMSFGLSPGAGTSKTQFLFEVRAHLERRHAAGRRTALILDEAQSLPDELLEEVRLLSNIETATAKLLSVVLAGQPELAARLNTSGLRQLKQRVSIRCEIGPLTTTDAANYIAGRLRIAGGNPSSIFSREAILAITEVSGGLPRVINVVCDNALIGGFAAQAKPVRRAIVDEVCRDFDLHAPAAAQPSSMREAVPVASSFLSVPSERESRVEVAQADDEPLAEVVQRKRFSFL